MKITLGSKYNEQYFYILCSKGKKKSIQAQILWAIQYLYNSEEALQGIFERKTASLQ